MEKGTDRCWGAQGPGTLGCGLEKKSCSHDFYEGGMMKSRGSGRLPCKVIIRLRRVRKQGLSTGERACSKQREQREQRLQGVRRCVVGSRPPT